MQERSRKTILVTLFFLLSLFGFLIFGLNGYNSTSANDKDKHGVYEIKLPPKSMDQYYWKEPSDYLMAMFGLVGPMGAMETHLNDGNMDKAKESFAAFKAQYFKVSKMVPEWSDHFPSEPIENLEKALDSVDYGKINPAIQGVGMTCAKCHQEHLPEVWYKYHWGDFKEIKISDPVTNKLLGFVEYMFGLHHSYSAVNTYLSEEKAGGKFNKTIEALYDLEKRVEALNVGCKECHGKEDKRRYFTSSDIIDLLSTARHELKKTQPNIEEVNKRLIGVGMGSCYKCHLVHVPAATVHRAWGKEVK
jgi:hypothetical protein